MHDTAHPGCGPARFLRFAAWALLGSSPVLAQAPTPDPVALAIEPLLTAASAEVRGEAALALAPTQDPKYYQSFLALAKSAAPAARRRAIVALGVLGQPGTDVLLNRILDKADRSDPERALAALALGLLPEEPRVPAIDSFFNRASAASRKRIRDELVCMMVGLGQRPHPSRATAIRRILEDATYRHRPELAVAIRALAQTPSEENHTALLALLGTRDQSVLCAVLRALANPLCKLTSDQVKRLIKLADQDRPAKVRGAVLDLLTAQRQPEALSLAGRALRGSDPTVAAAAVRTIRSLGGSTLRLGLEERILRTKNPELQAAMLEAKAGPHSDPFVLACIELARATERPMAVRVQAIFIVCEAGWTDLIPTASRLFLAAKDPATALRLAQALTRAGSGLPPTLLPRKSVEDIALLPMRLSALLSTGHENALAMFITILEKPSSTAMQIEVLRAYRAVRIHLLDSTSADLLPKPLVEILR